jgi:hypothetical protein
MVEPEPADAPEAPVSTTVQEKVVPETALDNATEVVVPEQMVCVDGVASATGIGLTVTTKVTGVPGQEFALGIME